MKTRTLEKYMRQMKDKMNLRSDRVRTTIQLGEEEERTDQSILTSSRASALVPGGVPCIQNVSVVQTRRHEQRECDAPMPRRGPCSRSSSWAASAGVTTNGGTEDLDGLLEEFGSS